MLEMIPKEIIIPTIILLLLVGTITIGIFKMKRDFNRKKNSAE